MPQFPPIPAVRGLLPSKSDVINKPQTSVRALQEEKNGSLLRKSGIFHRRRYRHQGSFLEDKNMMGREYFPGKNCIFLRTVA